MLSKTHSEVFDISGLMQCYDRDFCLCDGKTKKADSYIPREIISGLRDVTAHGYSTLRMMDTQEYASSRVPVFRFRSMKFLKK